jgi:hypothetical protein
MVIIPGYGYVGQFHITNIAYRNALFYSEYIK